MGIFLSRKQKRSETAAANDQHIATSHNGRSALFSERNQKLFFVFSTSFCLLLIVVGSSRALTLDASKAADEASASSNSSSHSSVEVSVPSEDTPDISAPKADIFIENESDSSSQGVQSQQETSVTVNGHHMEVNGEGSLEKTITSEDGTTSVDINVRQHSSGESETSSSIDIHHESTSSANSDINSEQEDPDPRHRRPY